MYMKKNFRIIILASNFSILISRIITILIRRNINILYLKISSMEDSQIMRCILDMKNYEECVEKIIKQIEKQIGVISVSYQEKR